MQAIRPVLIMLFVKMCSKPCCSHVTCLLSQSHLHSKPFVSVCVWGGGMFVFVRPNVFPGKAQHVTHFFFFFTRIVCIVDLGISWALQGKF